MKILILTDRIDDIVETIVYRYHLNSINDTYTFLKTGKSYILHPGAIEFEITPEIQEGCRSRSDLVIIDKEVPKVIVDTILAPLALLGIFYTYKYISKSR